MAGYLIAEEGPLLGRVIAFEEGNEWTLGRDPDAATIVLEDPMVSRKHVICRKTPEGYLLENLSAVNPATQNGKVISEAVLMREGDIIQIGNTFFRFSEKIPSAAPAIEEASSLSSLHFAPGSEARWVLKVISGPNSGAEFNMQKGGSYVLGKDPNLCDIVFQDLSVSRQHARMTVDDQENLYVEDMGSRNGTLVNGEVIGDKRLLSSEDVVALGTTTFLVIDRNAARETIFSAPAILTGKPESVKEAVVAEKKPREWKEMIIPTKHLVIAGMFGTLVLLVIMGMFALFKSEPIPIATKNETQRIEEAVKLYPDVQFSYNEGSGKLFLLGHVLTGVDKQELIYKLKRLPFLEKIDDNVVIDEYVWQNLNALLATNPDWIGVSIHSPSPGRFVMRGYLQTVEQAQALSDYINMNFPYLDRFDNQVVVENNLSTQIESKLIEKGFSGVTFQLSNGELVLAGRVDEDHKRSFNEILTNFKALMGIRTVKNFVVFTTANSSRVDVSSTYQVTGYSKGDTKNLYVLINGRILSNGDILDGMLITAIQPNNVLLEKDGIKYLINYNLQ